MKHLVLLGSAPPTIGGVSVHVARLAGLAMSRGWAVTLIDLYSKKTGVVEGAKVIGPSGLTGKIQAVSCVLRNASVVHLHLSACNNAYAIFLISMFATLRTRLVITIHSGSFPEAVSQMNSVRKGCILLAFKVARNIIAVSNEISIAVQKLGINENKISVIPAYIPLVVDVTSKWPKGKEKPHGTTVLLASGYCTMLYGWKTLLGAFSLLPETFRLDIALYNIYDPDLYEYVSSKASENSRIKIYNNLGQREFAELMAACDVFVRSTLSDGDSIAIREAIGLGKAVVASDAVARPPECLIFKVDDVIALREMCLQAAGNVKQVGSISQGGRAEGLRWGERVLDIYSFVCEDK